MALALRISSKITPSLPASRFPGARLFRGGGGSSPALLRCPRGPRHLPSPGVPEPALRACRARGWHLALMAIPRPLAGSQAAGQPGGAGVACTEPPPPLFSAVPVELAPLVYNCHLHDFSGPPAVHSSGERPGLPSSWACGLWGSSVGGWVVGSQGSSRCEQCCRGQLQGWGQGWAPGVYTRAAATWSMLSGLGTHSARQCPSLTLPHRPTSWGSVGRG